MSGHNVNIYFQEKTYQKIKPLIKQRKVSEFVNKLVEKELNQTEKQEKEQLRKRLIEAYKRESEDQASQEELAIWDEISGDGLDDE
jgi:uncharacterized protein YnzC (UPF0291/DUF896 family)